MFRPAEISAIARQISSRLTHPGWKKFKEEWERRSIARFLEERDRELHDNPFLRPEGRFDVYHETDLFLSLVLQRFVDRAEAIGPVSGKRYRYAAIELADVLGVRMPSPTPKLAQSADWCSAFMPQEVEEWPAWQAPALPEAFDIRTRSFFPPTLRTVAAVSEGPLAPIEFIEQRYGGRRYEAPAPAAPKPPAPPADDARLAALHVLMSHPATSEQDRRAAMVTYMSIVASRAQRP